MDEVRTALELATDEELQTLTELLFQRKFNPLDYVCTPEPIEVQSRDRQSWFDAIEERFQFLAADGVTVLQRRFDQISYRQVLIQVCCYLKIAYSQSFSTLELESEIFLHILQRTWAKLPANEQKALNHKFQQTVSQSQIVKQVPFSLRHNPIGVVLSGSSALAVNSVVRPWLLQQIARQIALHTATYQVTKQALLKGATTATAQIHAQVVMKTASRGIALNSARYAAARGVFAFMGTAMWMWFAADLGWRAIATNYARIIPVVFTLAQIRLIRAAHFETECYEMA